MEFHKIHHYYFLYSIKIAFQKQRIKITDDSKILLCFIFLMVNFELSHFYFRKKNITKIQTD